jgi:hypothetical protein
VGPSPSMTPHVPHSSSLPPGLDNPQKLQEALEVALRREKKYQERLGHYEKVIVGLTKKYDAVSVCRTSSASLLRASSDPRVALCPVFLAGEYPSAERLTVTKATAPIGRCQWQR